MSASHQELDAFVLPGATLIESSVFLEILRSQTTLLIPSNGSAAGVAGRLCVSRLRRWCFICIVASKSKIVRQEGRAKRGWSVLLHLVSSTVV